MDSLCQYRDIFGAPGEGLHAHRLGTVAIVDLALTVVAAAALAWTLNYSFVIILIIVIISGILVHRLFCVNSTLNVMIFGEIKKTDTTTFKTLQ
jgi:hypothetical protein